MPLGPEPCARLYYVTEPYIAENVWIPGSGSVMSWLQVSGGNTVRGGQGGERKMTAA